MTFVVGDQRFEAAAGDFVFAPKDVPHAYLVTSEHAEYIASFAPAGVEAFFAEVAPPVRPGESAPAPREPDPGGPRIIRSRIVPAEVARIAARYGVEVVGAPPTLG